ncbi:MAG: flagella basal body P-ring formation protein FlgA [Phycisphaerales bacterium JB054]
MHARTLTILLLAVATLWLPSPARAQTTLRLDRTARVLGDEPLRLGNIATLTGTRAGELAGLILIEDPISHPTDADGWCSIGIDLVRQTVEARLGAAVGLVAFQGSECDIRVLGRAQHTDAPTTAAAPKPRSATADALIGLQTVRGAVAREISRILQTPPHALRLTFGPTDAQTLDTPTTGRVVQIDPVGSSARMPIRVSVYEPNRLVLRESLRVGVLVRREVAVVSRAVTKRSILGPEDFTTETRWVSPTDSFASPEVALGAAAMRSLSPGETIESRLVEPPVVIEKGDPAMVRVILDGIVLRRAAYAREPGRAGDTIEFSPQHDPKTRFRATVIGKGEAQVWTFQGPAATGTPVASDSADD